MTPKEKANEIFDKYFDLLFETHIYGKDENPIIKEAAIIVVKEILDDLPPTLLPDKTDYWQKVMDELNAL